jgi:aspartate ammonia-lyase
MHSSCKTVPQSGCESLPTQVEALAMKTYKYFHICAVSVTELQRIYDKDSAEYKTVLKLGKTNPYFR